MFYSSLSYFDFFFRVGQPFVVVINVPLTLRLKKKILFSAEFYYLVF